MADKPLTRLSALGIALACSWGLSCGDAGDADAPPSAHAASTNSVEGSLEEDAPYEPRAGLDRVSAPERSLASLRERPTFPAALRRCAASGSFCVHRAPHMHEDSAAELLREAPGLLDALLAMRLPRPIADGTLGGDARIDLYLDDREPAARAYVDPGSAFAGFDRGTSFVVTPPLGAGCVGRQRLASAIAGGMLLSHDAALDPGTLTMLGGYLGVRASPCSVAELEAIDTAQRSPEKTFFGEPRGEDPASFLFPWFLEDRHGTNEPGKLAFALAAIASQKTPKGSALIDEPDVFDALRVSFHGNKSSIADSILEFAIHRAFIGSRSDEMHMVDVAKYGDLGRVRFEWVLDYDTLPKRVGPDFPIEPLGASYLYIDLKSATADSSIHFSFDWEAPVGFRWAAVKIAPDGSELGRKEITPVLGSTHIEASIENLQGASALIVVGIHEGEARRNEPFDPGRLREPAKRYLVTIAK